MKTRKEIDAALDALAQQLPAMIAENHDEADFWPEFAGVADEVTENVGAADCDHVQARLDSILEVRAKIAQ